MKTFFKYLITILVCSSFIFNSAIAQAQNILKVAQKGDIIINEVSWSGSSYSQADEWIELYNTTQGKIDLSTYKLAGINGKGKTFNLSGEIFANSYFIISNLSNLSLNSSLIKTPDLVASSISIPNSTLNIQLIRAEADVEFLIDEVNTNGALPFSGENESALGIRSSMERIDFAHNGNEKASWKSSSNAISLKPNKLVNSKCTQNFATPGAENSIYKPGELKLEFRNLCVAQGEIKTEGEKTFVELKGPLVETSIVNFILPMQLEQGNYSVSLSSNSTNKTDINPNNSEFSLSLDDNIFSKMFTIGETTDLLKFNKHKSIKTAVIKLKLSLDKSEVIQLNNILIKLYTKIESEEIVPDKFVPNVIKHTVNQINGSVLIQKSIDKSQKIIDFPYSYHCLNSQACILSLNITNNTTESTDIADIYFEFLDQDGQSQRLIKQVKSEDFVKSKTVRFDFNVNNSTSGKFRILVYLLGTGSIEVGTITFTPVTSISISSNLISYSDYNWTQTKILRTGVDDKGSNGKIVDILSSSSTLSGKHTISYELKKTEDFKSSHDLISVQIFDEEGRKISDVVKQEKDLEFNKALKFENEFNLANSSRIYVIIKFYGNQKGAFSDLEFSQILIN